MIKLICFALIALHFISLVTSENDTMSNDYSGEEKTEMIETMKNGTTPNSAKKMGPNAAILMIPLILKLIN